MTNKPYCPCSTMNTTWGYLTRIKDWWAALVSLYMVTAWLLCLTYWNIFGSVSFCHSENLKRNIEEMKNEAEKRRRILGNKNSPQKTQGRVCSPTSCFTDCLTETKIFKLIWSLAVVSHSQIAWTTKTSWKIAQIFLSRYIFFMTF